MKEIDDALNALINVIKSTKEYNQYQTLLKKVKNEPELYGRICRKKLQISENTGNNCRIKLENNRGRRYNRFNYQNQKGMVRYGREDYGQNRSISEIKRVCISWI